MSANTGHIGVDAKTAFISKRSVPLDCIRATAIVMVVVFHVATRYPGALLDPVATLFRQFGTLGVDVFFPLSGYLITSFLLRHVALGSVRTFFLRRAFRIIPLYLVAVTFYYLAMRILDLELGIIDRIWIPYTFLTGWFIFFDGVASVPYTITWSLSVEEFSYVLIGLAALVSRRSLPAFLIFVSLFSVGLRFYLNTIGHADIYHFPLARVDSIAIGGVMAWLITRGRPVIGGLIAGIVASLLLRQLGGAFAPTFLYTLVTFLTCLAIAVSEKWLSGYRGTSGHGLCPCRLLFLFHLPFSLHGARGPADDGTLPWHRLCPLLAERRDLPRAKPRRRDDLLPVLRRTDADARAAA